MEGTHENLPVVPVKKIVDFAADEAPGVQTVVPAESKPAPAHAADPYATDRFSLRELDLPQPKTVSELRSKLTPFKRPLLPSILPNQNEDGDGDVLTGFRGYISLGPDKLEELQVDRSSDKIEVSIDDGHGNLNKWSEKNGELKIKNYNGDPYSLVISMPDHRMLYLKFYPKVSVDEVDHTVRGMRGWLVFKQNGVMQSASVAVIDYHHKEFETQWPKRETIRKILPENLSPK